MNSITFPEVNKVFAEGNEDYEAHCFIGNSRKGGQNIVSCYRLSFRERLLVLVTGRIWVNITSGNGKLYPMYLSAIKQHVILSRKQARKRNEAIKKAEAKDSESSNHMKAV